ncbi:MAG: outer membrane lipoprotein-sorting protein [Calditrichaeota bacterium]|nr:outer membrane lipoprotein-sorting protein [Calditrichota bacterium]
MKSPKNYLLMSFFLLIAGSAYTQSGQTVLARIDSVLSAPKDMIAAENMTLIDKNGTQKVRKIKIYQKGSQKRLVRFLSPADVRGVGFLRLSKNRLYLYLPAFRRVRRIASSVRNENFMGTDFSYEDMSQSSYGKDYTVKSMQQTAKQVILELIPRPNADVSYGKLVLFADKSNNVVRKVEYYTPAGTLQKIMKIDDIQKIDGYWFGMRMEMQTVKNGHRTVLKQSRIQFDQGLKDSFFSERNLKRVK